MMTLKNTHALEQAKALENLIERVQAVLTKVLETGEVIPLTIAVTMDNLKDDSEIVSGSICFAPTSMILHHITKQMEAMPEELRSTIMMSLVVDHMGEMMDEITSECDNPDCNCKKDVGDMTPETEGVH
jgi:hypothetical protein